MTAKTFDINALSPESRASAASASQINYAADVHCKKADGKRDYKFKAQIIGLLWSEAKSGKFTKDTANKLINAKKFPTKYSRSIKAYVAKNSD
jgi:hypothetical protein|tara:strand:+ start:15 stop:293 length:279 start_codon:yes stop_codon:yes gene_type:complete